MADSALNSPNVYQPLAAKLRANNLDEYVGQTHLMGEDAPLRHALEQGHIHSMIFWGPPGVGKTTLAHIIAQHIDAHFMTLSAVLAGVKDIRQAVEEAKFYQSQGEKTVLFVDEVHRFNKSQQDAFLPHVEAGTIIFIGATTENPSFELNNALLSRARVYILRLLDKPALQQLMARAIAHYHNMQLTICDTLQEQLIIAADGDARRLLNSIELVVELCRAMNVSEATEAIIAQALADSYRRFDKKGESFYDQISALHKSVRGSDPDASLYWFCRMIDGGCDPLYIARRVVRMASEDIGNADPRALEISNNAWQTQERLGSPEGELAIAQAVVYMACAPKSNAVYSAFNQMKRFVKDNPSNEVPLHLRNAPTKLMKDEGYGAEYRYAHDYPNAYVPNENYFPEDVAANKITDFYKPVERGLEIKIKQKLETLKSIDKRNR